MGLRGCGRSGLREERAYGGVDLKSWSWREVGLKVVIFPILGFSKLGCGLSIGFGYFNSVERELD